MKRLKPNTCHEPAHRRHKLQDDTNYRAPSRQYITLKIKGKWFKPKQSSSIPRSASLFQLPHRNVPVLAAAEPSAFSAASPSSSHHPANPINTSVSADCTLNGHTIQFQGRIALALPSLVSPRVCLSDMHSLYSFFMARAALSDRWEHFEKCKSLDILSVKMNGLFVCMF